MYVYRSDGRCFVLAHGDESVSDDEFAELLSAMRSVAETHGEARMLVYAAGDGGPNAKQRAQIRDLDGLNLTTAIITNSRVVRAIVTAISWVSNEPLRTFAIDQANEALQFLQLEASERKAMVRLLDRACAEARLPALPLRPAA